MCWYFDGSVQSQSWSSIVDYLFQILEKKTDFHQKLYKKRISIENYIKFIESEPKNIRKNASKSLGRYGQWWWWSVDYINLHMTQIVSNWKKKKKLVWNICVHGGWFFPQLNITSNYVKPIDSKQHIKLLVVEWFMKVRFIYIDIRESHVDSNRTRFFWQKKQHTQSSVVLAYITAHKSLTRHFFLHLPRKKHIHKHMPLNGLYMKKIVTNFEKRKGTQA